MDKMHKIGYNSSMFNRNKNRQIHDAPTRQEAPVRPELTREERIAKAAGWVAALTDDTTERLCTGFGGPMSVRQAAAQAVRNEFRELQPDEALAVETEIITTIEQAGGSGAYFNLLNQQEAAARQQQS